MVNGVVAPLIGVDDSDPVAVDPSSSNVTPAVRLTRTFVGGDPLGPNDLGIPAIGIPVGTGTFIPPPPPAIPAAIAIVELLGSATMLVTL
jgi:hypothetical protein